MDVDEPSPPTAKSKRRSRRTVRRFVLVFLAILFGYAVLQAVSIHRFGFSDDGRQADCAIVLGAAAYHHKPSPVFEERIKHAIGLYKSGRVRFLVLTGGFGEGAEFAESQVARRYCLDHGIPEEALLFETESQTTLQNLAEARKLLDSRELESALVVSDPWHLKRAVAMARSEGILEAYPAGTPTTRFKSIRSRASFLLRELYFYHQFLVTGH